MLKILYWVVVWFIVGIGVLAMADDMEGNLFDWIYNKFSNYYLIFIFDFPIVLLVYYIKNKDKQEI